MNLRPPHPCVVRHQTALRPERTRIIPKFGGGQTDESRDRFFQVGRCDGGLNFDRRWLTTLIAQTLSGTANRILASTASQRIASRAQRLHAGTTPLPRRLTAKLRKFLLPITQHVGLHCTELADSPIVNSAFLNRGARRCVKDQTSSNPSSPILTSTRAFNFWPGLNVTTRLAEMGSFSCLGVAPGRWRLPQIKVTKTGQLHLLVVLKTNPNLQTAQPTP